MIAESESFSSRPALELSQELQERPVTEYRTVISKYENDDKPELQLVERIDEMRS